MERFKEIILPIIFSVITSIAHSFKIGKTNVVQVITEAITSFILGWITYFVLTEWYHVNYHIVCGVCGVCGYLAPKLMSGFELFTDTFITTYNEKLKNK